MDDRPWQPKSSTSRFKRRVRSSSIAAVFGAVTSTRSLPSYPFGYGAQAGYYTNNETGRVLCGLRHYNPGTGQFINRDPIGYDDGANVYAFCGNNPINEMDPEGTGPVGIPVSSGKCSATDAAAATRTTVPGGTTAREIEEQITIEKMGGVHGLDNIRNPIGMRRQQLLPPQYRRTK